MVGMKVRLRNLFVALVAMTGTLCCPAISSAQPAQNLPSALLVFPYVNTEGGDTRIELVNLSGEQQQLQCFWVYGDSCSEIGFFLSLTPYQPVSFLATRGLFNVGSNSAVPGFFGVGELKCAVVANEPTRDAHNAIQGRAIVFEDGGNTVSYTAVGFRRLSDGAYTGIVHLNNSEYAACPNRLHFQVFTDDALPSELILVPCDQDLILQIPTELTVQFLITNEFEQTFSASIGMRCTGRFVFSDIGDFFTESALGTATAHISARGVQGPLLGLVIDQVNLLGVPGTAGNEPSFEGNRSATVQFPNGVIE